MWRSHCKLQSNKNLPDLDRVEGGLGGNNNKINKQVRFNMDEGWFKKDSIGIIVCNSEDEKWTAEQLDDLLQAFVKTCNAIIDADYINGCIVLTN